jgi:hypothetical protein
LILQRSQRKAINNGESWQIVNACQPAPKIFKRTLLGQLPQGTHAAGDLEVVMAFPSIHIHEEGQFFVFVLA